MTLHVSSAMHDQLLQQRLDFFIGKVFQHLNDGANLRQNWLVGTMAHHLTGVMDGRVKRLIINVPPRHLKSISTSVAFPAFLLGNNPQTTILLVCYSSELGEKMMRDLRSVMQSGWYRRVFPRTTLSKNTAGEVVTSRNGGVNMTSINGTLTGRGADLIIIDDPIKPVDVVSDVERRKANEWLSSTLFTRLNQKKEGRIVVTMQRLHEDDVTGHLTREPEHGWRILKVPAIAVETTRYPLLPRGSLVEHERVEGTLIDPDREDKGSLDQLRRELGTLNFSAQYQQEPLPREGNLVKAHWFGRFDSAEQLGEFDAIVASWDTASATGLSNDWSVGTVWGVQSRCYFLLDLHRVRLDYPALRKRVRQVTRTSGAHRILLEKADSGRSLVQDLRADASGPKYLAVSVRFSKEDRFAACSAIVEEGRVFLPYRAPWLAELERELLGFPGTRHDDQVDSVAMFLNYMRKQKGGKLVLSPTGRQKPQRRRLRGVRGDAGFPPAQAEGG